VSVDGVADLLSRAHSLAGEAGKPAPNASERERLVALAAEFESTLLLQMLKEMRKAGSWDDDGDGDTLGAETLLETLDVELAKHLSSVQSLGLRDELLLAFDRRYGTKAASPAESGNPESAGATGNPQPSVAAPKPSTTMAFAPIHPPVTRIDELTADPMDELARPAGKITSAFGWRSDPLNGASRFHGGIDVRAKYGQEVNSAGAGRVVFSGDQRGYGTTVIVEHADGVQTRYAHLSAALVQKGDAISAGQVLGRAGQSGRATGPHLHFEVIANGVRVDPATLNMPAELVRGVPGLKPEGVVADLAVRRTTPFQETSDHDHEN